MTNAYFIVIIWGMLKDIVKGLVDLVYPKICIVCRKKLNGKSRVDSLVCMECWVKIKKNLPPFCCSCGRHLEKNHFTKHVCPACIKNKLHFDRAFSPCVFEGVLKELVHEFKYKGKDYLGRSLSRLMIEFIQEYNLPLHYLDLIIPVPLHNARLREREFNQAEVLSNHIAATFNKKVLTNNLIRHRPTRTQIELDEENRLLNIKGCFSVKENRDIKGKNILLVDDVLTTSATSSEAAKTLKNAGANIVFVLTLAN